MGLAFEIKAGTPWLLLQNNREESTVPKQLT